jgi:outer membrane protein assembly factor BamA
VKQVLAFVVLAACGSSATNAPPRSPSDAMLEQIVGDHADRLRRKLDGDGFASDLAIRDRIADTFLEAGFLEATVIVSSSGKPITATISPGPRYRLSSITIDDTALLDALDLETGGWFDMPAVRRQIERVYDRLHRDGHVRSNVLPLTKVDRQKHTIAVSLEIDRGTTETGKPLFILE